MENQVSYLLPFSTNSLTGYMPLMSGKKTKVLGCCAPISVIKKPKYAYSMHSQNFVFRLFTGKDRLNHLILL